MVEVDSNDRSPWELICVPAATQPQSCQLHHCCIAAAGGVESSLVMADPSSYWPSCGRLTGSPPDGLMPQGPAVGSASSSPDDA